MALPAWWLRFSPSYLGPSLRKWSLPHATSAPLRGVVLPDNLPIQVHFGPTALPTLRPVAVGNRPFCVTGSSSFAGSSVAKQSREGPHLTFQFVPKGPYLRCSPVRTPVISCRPSGGGLCSVARSTLYDILGAPCCRVCFTHLPSSMCLNYVLIIFIGHPMTMLTALQIDLQCDILRRGQILNHRSLGIQPLFFALDQREEGRWFRVQYTD